MQGRSTRMCRPELGMRLACQRATDSQAWTPSSTLYASVSRVKVHSGLSSTCLMSHPCLAADAMRALTQTCLALSTPLLLSSPLLPS